ncbi:AbrB/MazE/SpoVT family DNA-binding domain-containing protein [Cetobacterium sp.]
MKLILKITKIGNAKGVIIPKNVLDNLGKDIKDYIEIEIKEK